MLFSPSLIITNTTAYFVLGWNQKCGFWTPDPFNDYCYLFNYLSMRPWAESRADCVNQGGDLVSITDPFEQAFLQGNCTPLTPAMCMGVTTQSYTNITNTKKTPICSSQIYSRKYAQCVHLL